MRFILAALLLAGCAHPGSSQQPPAATGLARIGHVVVIYLENRSFDNLYGDFPGADGRGSSSARRYPQIDASGTPYKVLPQAPDSPYPPDLPNAPFDITRYLPPTVPSPNLTHLYYHEIAQIDGGRMDRFALVSSGAGAVMGYYPSATLPLAAEAHRYVLCDHFFHSAFGGSFFNHQFFIAAAAPVFPNAPPEVVAQIAPNGMLARDGEVTPDGYAVNTLFTVATPHPAGVPPEQLMPLQALPTIGDRMSDAGVSWAWYSGGWNDAVAGHPDSTFQFHHQPFAYYARYADTTKARAEHLKDEQDFLRSAKDGTLPAVSFVKPLGINNEHPGYAAMATGEQHALELIDAVRNGPNWSDAVIIVTYDENGGAWDHVAPPKGDRWGPGTRVPAIVISPFAKKSYVDHTTYETVSILALIEHRWHLPPLSERDKHANDLTNALDLSRP